MRTTSVKKEYHNCAQLINACPLCKKDTLLTLEMPVVCGKNARGFYGKCVLENSAMFFVKAKYTKLPCLEYSSIAYAKSHKQEEKDVRESIY